MGTVHYLDAGIYTVPDAARLIGATMPQVRGWIAGHPKSDAGPLLCRSFTKIGWRETLSFKNLIEALFIKAFADEGVSLKAIRIMAEEARRVLSDPNPFASQITFKTDGQKIYAEIFNKVRERTELYDLKTRNWGLEKILQEFLKQPIEFGPERYARLWYPRREIAPNVVVTPTRYYGQPVIKDSGVPTSTLADALKAEQGDYKKVARWYEVPLERVQEAERFEERLAQAA